MRLSDVHDCCHCCSGRRASAPPSQPANPSVTFTTTQQRQLRTPHISHPLSPPGRCAARCTHTAHCCHLLFKPSHRRQSCTTPAEYAERHPKKNKKPCIFLRFYTAGYRSTPD